jgi:hypothetical protein
MLFTIQRKDPSVYVLPVSFTGVSTASLNNPIANPVSNVARHPVPFNRFIKIPKKKTTNMGGAR